LRSPSTPLGSIDMPLTPALLALGAGARFVSRSVDTLAKHLAPTFAEARAHRGTSFIEVLQNCPVFHDGAWDHVKDKLKHDTMLFLEHGKPMLFGDNKGLRLKPNTLELEIVTIGEGGITEADVLIHDETNRPMAFLLAGLEPPNFPIALGVILRDPAPSYDASVLAQVESAKAKGEGDIDALLRAGHTWTVE
jgi:2-oxoglutarate ferredoxin oxidoreductase subunit beta